MDKVLTVDYMIEVLKGFNEGKPVQYRCKGAINWEDTDEPKFNWEAYEYRLKPELKFRLPTKEEFDSLKSYFSRINVEAKGLEVMNNKGEILFFPATGIQEPYSDRVYYNGEQGTYWTSTVCKSLNYRSLSFFFDINRGVADFHYAHLST